MPPAYLEKYGPFIRAIHPPDERPDFEANQITGGNGDDTIRITSSNPNIRFDVAGDNGNDRIELYGTWAKVRAFGGAGTDTLKTRGIGVLEIHGIELVE